MKPPRQTPPVCCGSHTNRYMPVPETDAERAAVDKALNRWDDEFWLLGECDGRSTVEDLPDYVVALIPTTGDGS